MVRDQPDPPSALHSAITWGISSAGRAPALQAGGRRFDPVILHQIDVAVCGILVFESTSKHPVRMSAGYFDVD